MGDAARQLTAEDTHYLPVFWVAVEKFEELTGVTKRAVESKIYRGSWELGLQYCYDPDGAIRVSIQGWNEWVQNSQREYGRARKTSKSGSSGKAKGASKGSPGRPRQRTLNGPEVSVLK